jgi:hypothetical protein
MQRNLRLAIPVAALAALALPAIADGFVYWANLGGAGGTTIGRAERLDSRYRTNG